MKTEVILIYRDYEICMKIMGKQICGVWFTCMYKQLHTNDLLVNLLQPLLSISGSSSRVSKHSHGYLKKLQTYLLSLIVKSISIMSSCAMKVEKCSIISYSTVNTVNMMHPD